MWLVGLRQSVESGGRGCLGLLLGRLLLLDGALFGCVFVEMFWSWSCR